MSDTHTRESREQHDRRARQLQRADARRRAQTRKPVTSVTRQVDPFALAARDDQDTPF